MKALLILLFLALPISAQDKGIKWDEITIGALGVGSIVADSMWHIWEVPIRDSTKWYIKEIKQKCDTIWAPYDCPHCTKRNNGFMCDVAFYERAVTCIDDTIWVKKIQIYLTPTELKQLMELLKE